MLNYFYFFTQFKNKILNKQTNFQNIIFFKNIIFFYFWLFVIFYLFYIFINATFYISWFNNNFFWTMNNSKLFFLITGCSIIYLFFYNVYFKIKPKIFFIFFIIATLIIIFFVNFIFLQTNFLLLLLLLEISTIALFLFLINELNIFYQKNFKKFILLKFIKLFFFQFWISFLTSIVLILILANFYLLYGSLSYWYFNYCVVFNFQQFNTSLFYILLLAFFLKFGLAPAHFLKASLYNTLSYSLIFIFTYIYMSSFFFFFFQLITIHVVNAISLTFLWLLLLLLGFSFFFAFYSTSLKSLFAFSTILNFMNNLIILSLCFIIV